ncbi:MAG TPA: ABC transporter permease, partial [Thermotogota bacterium]|nr:ABC transporter permease [Thermotogota bacterium]HPJ89595.1 ABC transporter permease [Thermotogota bacterium]
MKDTLIILRKEFANLFKDKRTVFSIFFLPVILFVVIFYFINMMSTQEEAKLDKTVYKIYTNNAQVLKTFASYLQDDYIIVDKVGNLEEDLRDSKIHLAVIFDGGTTAEDFLTNENLKVQVYSYSGSSASERIQNNFYSSIRTKRDEFLKQELESNGMSAKLLEMPNISIENVATEKEMAGSFLGMLLPYMLVLYLFTSSFSIGFDTTAGEKERQTLTILLSNQVSRTSIAWAKILYIMLMNITSATISIIAFIIAFSTMMKGVPSDMLAAFNFETVMVLLFTTIGMAVLIAAIIVVVGIFAKSVKEASSYTMPIFVIVIIFGVMSMQPEAFKETGMMIYIPLINGIITLKQLFTTPNLPIYEFVVSLLVNLGVTSVLVFLASKMFSNEKFVFRT